MSHFTVLVIGDDPEDQLAPYHEFECTGRDDQYVQDVDETTCLRTHYENGTTRKVRDSEGNYYDPYENRFYREPTEEEKERIGNGGTGFTSNGIVGFQYTSKDWEDGKGYRPKVGFLPEGLENVKVPYKDVMSFREFISDYEGRKLVPFGEEPKLKGDHKYGYALLDEKGDILKVVNRTNPNRKWDWYQLGGRWQGFFKLKEGTKGKIGKAGLFSDPVEKGYVDQALKKDIDFDGMKEAKKGFVTFALIKDGQWYERGSMGWWGVVSNEDEEWGSKFTQLLEEISDDTLLSVYDCHI
jgi:hypothetical protein